MNAATRRLPFGTTCLVDALAADAMLRRRGIDCTVRFGVRAPRGSGRLEAHAWLEHDGEAVLGRLEDRAGYAPLAGARSARS